MERRPFLALPFLGNDDLLGRVHLRAILATKAGVLTLGNFLHIKVEGVATFGNGSPLLDFGLRCHDRPSLVLQLVLDVSHLSSFAHAFQKFVHAFYLEGGVFLGVFFSLVIDLFGHFRLETELLLRNWTPVLALPILSFLVHVIKVILRLLGALLFEQLLIHFLIGHGLQRHLGHLLVELGLLELLQLCGLVDFDLLLLAPVLLGQQIRILVYV